MISARATISILLLSWALSASASAQGVNGDIKYEAKLSIQMVDPRSEMPGTTTDRMPTRSGTLVQYLQVDLKNVGSPMQADLYSSRQRIIVSIALPSGYIVVSGRGTPVGWKVFGKSSLTTPELSFPLTSSSFNLVFDPPAGKVLARGEVVGRYRMRLALAPPPPPANGCATPRTGLQNAGLQVFFPLIGDSGNSSCVTIDPKHWPPAQ